MSATPSTASSNPWRTWLVRTGVLLALGLVAAFLFCVFEVKRAREADLDRALKLVANGDAQVGYGAPMAQGWLWLLRRPAASTFRSTLSHQGSYLADSATDWRTVFERSQSISILRDLHDPAAVRSFVDCPTLIALSAQRRRLDPERWEAIAACSQVLNLNLTSTDLKGLDLGLLQGRSRLEYLWMSSTGVDDGRLAFLAGYDALERLDLNDDDVSGGFLALRESWPELKELSVCRTKFDAAAVAMVVARCPRLRLFRAAGGSAIDDSAAAFGGMSETWLVNLNHTQAGDAVAAGLARSKSLRWICLAGTPLTAKGFFALAAVPTLKSLHVYQTAVTPDDVAEFNRRRPDVEVCGPGYEPQEGDEDR